ncbi:MAG: hypothetical protein CMM87_02695 [Rickettsiales bacterium]|nr:hypothetical protein [Rickettsiales bacterium]|tara:strand:- start:6305 stop:7405 length:1101 start_codon:yes stop_codon:yes gene_type:complete
MKSHFVLATFLLLLTQALNANLPEAETLTRYLKAIEHIQKYYPTFSQKQLVEKSVDTLAQSIDSHGKLIDIKAQKDLGQQLSGQFKGVGVVIGHHAPHFVIDQVLNQSPAEKSGLAAGDHILAINEQETAGMTLKQLMSILATPDQRGFKLMVQRKKDLFDVRLNQGQIPLSQPTLKWNQNIAILTIPSFLPKNFTANLYKLIRQINPQTTKGLIIDLRGNGGGLIESGLALCNLFIENKTITQVQEKGTNHTKKYLSGNGQLFPNLKIILIVDGQTASTAEIVVGCFKDHKRAKIIGSPTYGKGSIQSLIRINQDWLLQLTTHHYLTPNGHSIDKKGVAPDLILNPQELEKAQEKALNLIKIEDV